MNSDIKKATLILTLLLGLTTGSYLIAENGAMLTNSSLAAPTILFIAFCKFFLIFLFFMEMKRAHLFWKFMMTSILLVIALGYFAN